MTENYFTDALYQNYLQSGKSMSENVSRVLSKSLIELTEDEREAYKTYILPSKGVIKNQIKEILEQPGVNEEEWQSQLQNYGQSIIGQMVAEVIIELGLPTAAVEEVAPQPIEETPQPPQVTPTPAPPVSPQVAPASVPPVPPQKKSNVKKLVILLVSIVVVFAVIGAIVGVTTGKDDEETKTEASETTTQNTTPKTISLSITTPTGMQQVNNPQIAVSGKTEPGAKVTIKSDAGVGGYCDADSTGAFATVITLPTTPSMYTINVRATTDEGEAEKSVICEFVEDPAAYKAKCQTLDYRVVSKNADNYIGQFFYARGEVFQIMEQGNTTFMLVAVTDSGYGFWDDNVAVYLAGTTDALEESIVRIWGSCGGNYTYESVAGYTITVPQIDAEYVEVERL